MTTLCQQSRPPFCRVFGLAVLKFVGARLSLFRGSGLEILQGFAGLEFKALNLKTNLGYWVQGSRYSKNSVPVLL